MNTQHHRSRTLTAALLFVAGGVALSGSALLAQAPPPITVQVDAGREEWLHTGIDLREGEKITISASGTAEWEPGVANGPAGVVGETPCVLVAPAAPIGALLGRVGTGAPSVVGEGATLTGPGPVYLLYNDCSGQYFDNRGAFQTLLTVVAAPAPPPTVAPAPIVTAVPTAVAEATVAPAPVEEPEVAEPAAPGRRLPIKPVLVVLALATAVAAGMYRVARRFDPTEAKEFRRRYLDFSPLHEFSASARLESSAWLAPMWLQSIQNGRRRLRTLSIGGPDADIDFGVQGVWAYLHPMPDGSVRIEATSQGRVAVDDVPLVLAQRLKNGARIHMGTREFIFRSDAEGATNDRVTALRRSNDPLSRPDPRAA